MNFIDDSLTLGLGFPSTTTTTKSLNQNQNQNQNRHATTTKSLNQNQNQNQNRHVTNIKSQEPSLTLSLSGEMMWMSEKKMIIDERPGSTSGASSHTNNVVLSVKRERETTSSDDVEIEKDCSRVISDEDEDGTCLVITTTRKKLRLTKEQSAMLEENFKLHSTLNPKQKQGLADRLNLRPRQVEVWFQNRRARTKLKQTEVDCEYMKKWCETLTDENRKLQKELQDLKALNLVHPFYMHVPAATLTICPSCDTITAASTTLPSKHFYASAASAPNRPLLVDN